jgi:hypothetical protein
MKPQTQFTGAGFSTATAKTPKTLSSPVLKIEKCELRKTIGSAGWLSTLHYFVRFSQVEFDGFSGRVATVGVGGPDVVVACDGVALCEDGIEYVPSIGIQNVPLQLYTPNGTFFPDNPPLTPGAELLLDRIADRVREEFQVWLDDLKEAQNMEIRVVNRKHLPPGRLPK